jgi:hypothetical protein
MTTTHQYHDIIEKMFEVILNDIGWYRSMEKMCVKKILN